MEVGGSVVVGMGCEEEAEVRQNGCAAVVAAAATQQQQLARYRQGVWYARLRYATACSAVRCGGLLQTEGLL